MIRSIGPNTIFVQRFGVTDFANGAELQRTAEAAEPHVLRRARHRGQQPTTLQFVDIELGAGIGPSDPAARVLRSAENQAAPGVRHSENLRRRDADSDSRRALLQRHRGAVPQERRRARQHGVSAAVRAAGIDPIGKTVRVGHEQFEVVGVFDKRPAAGGFNLNAGRFRHDPVHRRTRASTASSGPPVSGQRCGITGQHPDLRPAARRRQPAARRIADIERVMRIRHGLRLDEPDDFDLCTQDAVPEAVGPRSARATFFALVVISSIALMVGGIGVMAIMSISVTERTREIGVRKALGARRAEILFQFLMEAAFLTSLGGVLGIALGSGHRLARSTASRAFPSRCRGGPSPSASGSRPRSASSSGCSRPSRPRASIRSKLCATNSPNRLWPRGSCLYMMRSRPCIGRSSRAMRVLRRRQPSAISRSSVTPVREKRSSPPPCSSTSGMINRFGKVDEGTDAPPTSTKRKSPAGTRSPPASPTPSGTSRRSTSSTRRAWATS